MTLVFIYSLLSFSSLDLLILKLKAKNSLCGTLTMQSMNVIISFIGKGHAHSFVFRYMVKK